MGDGNDCTLDSDGDGYPDVPLATCDEGNEAIYCIKVREHNTLTYVYFAYSVNEYGYESPVLVTVAPYCAE